MKYHECETDLGHYQLYEHDSALNFGDYFKKPESVVTLILNVTLPRGQRSGLKSGPRIEHAGTVSAMFKDGDWNGEATSTAKQRAEEDLTEFAKQVLASEGTNHTWERAEAILDQRFQNHMLLLDHSETFTRLDGEVTRGRVQ